MSAQTGTSALSSVTRTSDARTHTMTPSDGASETKPVELPQASQEAVNYLRLLDSDDFKFLLFDDELVTTSDTGRDLGEFRVSVETTKREGIECFLIHANSHGAIDNVGCGTSIIAYVDQNLDTLEQQHHEYVKLENHPLDRKTSLIKEGGNYVVNRTITQGQDVTRSVQMFPFREMDGFISEASNLLLLRLMAKRGVPDNFQVLSFDSEANLSPVVYTALEPRTQLVADTEVDVVGVERTINSRSDLPTTWQAYFLKDGHLTSRVQVGSPVTMKLLRVPTAIEEDVEPEKPTFEKVELNWEEDMEMYSKFLDRKEELKADHDSYMRQHPELKALLADFLQFLLLRKPDSVIQFAAEYFASFSHKIPSTTPYMDSSAASPFPQSRSNSKIDYLVKQK